MKHSLNKINQWKSQHPYKVQRMNFREEALWENKMSKREHRKTFWVHVILFDGNSSRWYQLPKDLQRAMWASVKQHPHSWQKILYSNLINIPISGYDEHGHAQITTGVIDQVQIRRYHMSSPEKISRSQVMAPAFDTIWQTANYQRMVIFMGHDFSKTNQQRIAHVIQHHIPMMTPYWIASRIMGVLGVIWLVLVSGNYFLERYSAYGPILITVSLVMLVVILFMNFIPDEKDLPNYYKLRNRICKLNKNK